MCFILIHKIELAFILKNLFFMLHLKFNRYLHYNVNFYNVNKMIYITLTDKTAQFWR